MDALKWNNGMSVGVETIDNDHKIIIALINKISRATDNNATSTVLEEVFEALEAYISSHFSREEQLMQDIGYPEEQLAAHKNSHQRFIQKIPELKDELIRSDSFEVAEKVNFFLHQWLINHILNEDMAYAAPAQKYFQTPRNNTPIPHQPIKTLSCWLSQHIHLRWRIALTALLPFMGLLLLSYMILAPNYQNYLNIQTIAQLNNITYHVNALTHNLQAERGLTSGYITSTSQQFTPELAARRKQTDQSWQHYIQAINQHQDLLKLTSEPRLIETIKQDYEHLLQLRQRIDQHTVDYVEPYQFFNNFIAHLLSIENNLLNIEMDSPLASKIIAVSALLDLKEVTGQERALGTRLIEQGYATPEQFQTFNILQGRQATALTNFNEHASEQQKQLCGEFCANLTRQIVSSRFFIDLLSGKSISISSKQWFDTMSQKMDQLKHISDQLIQGLNQQTEIKATDLIHRFYLVMAILFIVFTLSSFILLLLGHSIIIPIQRVTYALKELAFDNKEIRMYEQYANDEVGTLFDAYESLRLKLLQADIAQDLITGQRRSLQMRTNEQKHYKELASIDTLTGLLNRRKFEEIFTEEIHYARENGTPLSILLLDIDYFKSINDSYGHAVGDITLKAFAKLCLDSVRFSDIIARIGGEEFVILMPQTPLKHARTFAERIRKKVSNTIINADKNAINLTVSIGISQWNPQDMNHPKDLMNQVDAALYQAKNKGRNQVALPPEN